MLWIILISVVPFRQTAKYTMLAFLIFTGILISIMGLIHRAWNVGNDKRDALDPEGMLILLSVRLSSRRCYFTDKYSLLPGAARHIENEEFADLTDFQLRSFRYPI